ncbi:MULTISPECIES: type II toxin-antitoxin system YafQ family toxin [unclassified Lactobacillus]|uniref:type II toxin-antitoxin system YafQ family toxin n=1 Tax=unclassified Lactobacillus TaxID=2620435 RepID=UPI000EFA9A02|nr:MULTISPECIES: type II toxin-antitoxin system YafQ family toxin [unclassified Lactobacillus]RMC25057.1 type II toxin-antitoxin system YafQ family toxin [Lactobacillus sp. ESL0247]RMC29212.1 type II toxin-antitoxin system YafQ family toxin [Lactobacillus sp. ESL0246]RMC32815.1 type II toxin-antitoxin system YafQ family toxin [Lactobacillus sp. ESL0245]RMC49766.1 type II toxin-antitoxin system YafQ family toxin [Lactobacillus sp. ESL0228]
MKYQIKFTSQFKKDIKLAKKQGKSLNELYKVIEKIADGEDLATSLHDHALTGNFKGTRECHIEPDWLLVYEIFEQEFVLVTVRLGSLSQLFGK